MSFLSVFQSVLHAVEAAAKIAAPIIATQDPVIGGLMSSATDAAVGVEAAITAPGAGAQKAGVVSAQTGAVIGVINGILASQGKAALPAGTNDLVQASVKSVVSGLNAVATAVQAAPAAPPVQ
jgi:hypothetical protein